MTQVDILILSNDPGEITTWVRPVVKVLRQELGDDRSCSEDFYNIITLPKCYC